MSSSADKLSVVLDAARENLPEGDFLKVSNFLMDMHKTMTESTEKVIINIIEKHLNTEISYKTVKGKSQCIKLTYYKHISYRGSVPNESQIKGTINGEAFDLSEKEFVNKMNMRLNITGCRNIVRKIDDIEDEFPTLRKFYKYVEEIDRDANYDSDDEEEEENFDPSDWNPMYKMRNLFGIIYLADY